MKYFILLHIFFFFWEKRNCKTFNMVTRDNTNFLLFLGFFTLHPLVIVRLFLLIYFYLFIIFFMKIWFDDEGK